MAEIKVTSGELKNKATALRQLNTNLKKAVEEMTSNENSLVGMWDGEAKEAFHKAYESDRNQMDTFSQVIEKYCIALENNAAKYEQMEAKSLKLASERSYK